MCNNSYSCHGAGVFLMGAVAGMAAGAALNAAMTPSSTRQIKRAAHKAAKRVNEAVDHLADAMDMLTDTASRRHDRRDAAVICQSRAGGGRPPLRASWIKFRVIRPVSPQMARPCQG